MIAQFIAECRKTTKANGEGFTKGVYASFDYADKRGKLEDALMEAFMALEEIAEIDEQSVPGQYAAAAISRIEAILDNKPQNSI